MVDFYLEATESDSAMDQQNSGLMGGTHRRILYILYIFYKFLSVGPPHMKIKKWALSYCVWCALIFLAQDTTHIKIICLKADLESSPPSQKYRVIKRDLQ